jgi:hypothetical protein
VNGSTTKLGASYFSKSRAERGIATILKTKFRRKLGFFILTITLPDNDSILDQSAL